MMLSPSDEWWLRLLLYVFIRLAGVQIDREAREPASCNVLPPYVLPRVPPPSGLAVPYKTDPKFDPRHRDI